MCSKGRFRTGSKLIGTLKRDKSGTCSTTWSGQATNSKELGKK